MLDVILLNIYLGVHALHRRYVKFIHLSQFTNIFKPCIGANGFGILANKLNAVVILRIMTGSDNNAAIHTKKTRSEVDFFSTTLPYIGNIDAGIGKSTSQRGT